MTGKNVFGEDNHMPCESCEELIGDDNLYCPYCGTKNEHFSLTSFNEAQKIIDESFVPFTHISQVQQCENYHYKHDVFSGYKSQRPQAKFCFWCGKKSP